MSIFRVVCSLLVFVVVPLTTLAHTSDERYVSGMIVDLSTAPIAPLLNEKTGFLFSFLDPASFAVIETIREAQIEIVANERESGRGQEVVFSSESFPVVRGTLNFDYTFTEAGTYDVHIIFTDGEGKTYTTGFRRQVRDLTAPEKAVTSEGVLLGLSLGLAIGALLGHVLSEKKNKE